MQLTDTGWQASNGNFRLGGTTGTVEGQLGNLKDLHRVALGLTASNPNLRSVLPLKLNAIRPNTPVDASGTLGFTRDGLSLNKLQIALPDSEIQLSGDVKISQAEGNMLTSELRVEGSSTRQLELPFSDTPVLDDISFALDTSIKVSGSQYRLHPFRLEAGVSDLTGTITIETGETPDIQAQLHSQMLYLPFLLPDMEELEVEERAREAANDEFDLDEYTDSLTIAELQERIIPDQDLQTDFLRGFQGKLDYRIDQLSLKDGVSSTAHLKLSLQEGILRSQHLEWDGTHSSGQAEIQADTSEDTSRLQLTIDGQRMPLLWLLAGEPAKRTGDAVYRANVSAHGNTPRELAANLNDAIAFHSEGGTLDNRGLDLLMGDLLGEIFDRLNPASEPQAQTRVDCHAGALVVRDGLVEAIPGFILRTDKLDYVAAGSIDLKRESLNLAFSTRSRKGVGISAGRALTNYIKLKGTLANPRMALDAKGAAVSGSAALATAGWSILAESMWDRWVATAGDPCKRLLKKARKDKAREYETLLHGVNL